MTSFPVPAADRPPRARIPAPGPGIRRLLAAAFLGILGVLGFGASGAGAAEAGPADVARAMTRDLIDRIADAPQVARDADPAADAALVRTIEARLRRDVDFDYIARRVMGRAGRGATPEQLRRFTEALRTGLVRTYARTMAGFRIDDLEVLDTRIPERRDDRASVVMRVVAADGQTYPLEYSMARRDEGWQVLNVTVDRINLGLTLARQFERALEANDLETVIARWPDVGGEPVAEETAS